MKNIYKTSLFTSILSILFIVASIATQLRGESKLTVACSYTDPITIDILAFIVALFLIIEGIYKIIQNKDVALKNQITRSIRISVAFAILIMHIMQVMYK